MKYSDTQRIDKILEYSDMLLEYVKSNNLTRRIIEDDHIVQWTITTPLYNIGEHAYNLTKEFKEKTPQIQWNLISGLRHRLVHDYDGTNWEVIWDIIQVEIPELVNQLEQIRGESEI